MKAAGTTPDRAAPAGGDGRGRDLLDVAREALAAALGVGRGALGTASGREQAADAEETRGSSHERDGAGSGGGRVSPELVAAIEQAIANRNPRREGADVKFRCPRPELHRNGDEHPSCRWHRDKQVVYCDVCRLSGGAVDLAEALGIDTRRTSGVKRRVVARYDYRDESGEMLYQVERVEPGTGGRNKDFRCRRPDGDGAWRYNLDGVRRVLYCLPALLAADAAKTVYIVEGEGKVDRLAALGLVATCAPGGAGKWRPEYAEALRGRRVVVLRDADEPGRKHAEQVARSLAGVAATVKVIELPGLKAAEDIVDWLNAGHTVEELAALVEAAPSWTSGGDDEDDDPGSDRENGATASDAMEDATDDWGPLVPLDHARDLPPLPLDALSPWLRDMATHTARAYQVPPEFPALYALALVSGALAGKYIVQVRAGWRMPPVLYVLVGLPPSERKTPVIHALAEPVRLYERALAEAVAEERRAALARVKQLRAVEEAALRRVARPPKGMSLEDAARAHTVAARALDDAIAQVPPEARMIVEYATPEALAERMCDHDDRQIILSDEGAGVLAMSGRYARWGGADVDLLLRGYDGLPYTPARVTRVVRPMHAATLAIALGAQPAAVVELLREAPVMRERGLWARMLAVLPRPMVGRRAIRPAPVPPHVTAEYERRLGALLAVPDEYRDGRLAPCELRLSRGADDVIAALEAELEPAMGQGGRYERIGTTAGKLAGQAARIAACLHLADSAGGALPGEIPAATAERAVAIARACIPHAEAWEDMLAAPPELEGARRIAEWLHRHGQPVVSDREILRATRGAIRLALAEQRDAALCLLARHGYVRRATPDTAGGRRPSPRWEVRPDWLASRCRLQESVDNMDDIAAGEGAVPSAADSVHFVHGVAESANDACPDDDLEAALAGGGQ